MGFLFGDLIFKLIDSGVIWGGLYERFGLYMRYYTWVQWWVRLQGDIVVGDILDMWGL